MKRYYLIIISFVFISQNVFAETKTDEHLIDEEPIESVDENKPYKGEFFDTRLNFTLTNENIFGDPSKATVPNYPGWRFDVPNEQGTLFFDNYDTRFSGFETLSHAVLYKLEKQGNWDLEGSFVLRMNQRAERNIVFTDAGSYLRAAYWFSKDRSDMNRLSFLMFPTSSDRFRLGYSYRLSWGGNGVYNRTKYSVPGIKIQYENERFYMFAGAKSSVVINREIDEERAVLGGLAGMGFDITDIVRIEANGGYFDRGSNELPDLVDTNVSLYGGSLQLAIHKGMPVASSIDYKLYRNDPERVVNLFRKPYYPGGLSWLVTAEGTVLGQVLKKAAGEPGVTDVQYGYAGDVNVRLKADYFRFRMDLQYRDLAFMLHRTPSIPAFTIIPSDYGLQSNWFGSVGVDYHIKSSSYTIGLIAGLEQPATFTVNDKITVVRSSGDFSEIPKNEEVLPLTAVKLVQRMDLSESFSAIFDVYLESDPNLTKLERSGTEELFDIKPVFDEENINRFGLNFTVQARF